MDNVPFLQANAQQQSFDELKQALLITPVLRSWDKTLKAIMDRTLKTIMETDVSNQALADTTGRTELKRYTQLTSTHQPSPQMNGTDYDKELFAIIDCFKWYT
ncbi:hypothetical protein BDZ91DRAFT_804271 [Kalaharituber pfeilii]|nr:hypothetical protein BDZ91DRAFT_804271 [Kalaharituber pfeilii]